MHDRPDVKEYWALKDPSGELKIAPGGNRLAPQLYIELVHAQRAARNSSKCWQGGPWRTVKVNLIVEEIQ